METLSSFEAVPTLSDEMRGCPKITALKAYGCASPFSDWTFVKVETEDSSLYGWGECSLPGKTFGVQGAIRDLEKLLAGEDPLRTEYLWQRMYRHSYWRGGPIHTSAISGVDCALWDIRGKVLNRPICELLGGPVRRRVRLYANIGLSTDPAELAKRARHAVSLGYTAVKLYPLPVLDYLSGRRVIEGIVNCCGAVRDAIGPGHDFAVDFHGRPSAGFAVQLEAAIRDLNPLWIEEPVLPELEGGLRRCARKFRVPIATGERLFTRWSFKDLLEQELASVIQPDVSNAGGITELVKIAALAEMYGVVFNPHNPNGPLQSQTSLHLASYAPAFQMLEHRHEGHDFAASICTVVPKIEPDGCCTPPSGAGIGGAMIEAALAASPPQPWIPEAFRSDGSVADW